MRTAIALALGWVAACAGPAPTMQTPPPAKASPVARPVDPEPVREEAPQVVAAIERTEGRIVVTTAANAEELLLVPDGIVWTEGGDVRAAFENDETPRVLATLTDPHGLASDGRNVVWLGDEQNGRYEIATAKTTELPEVAGPGAQEGLAFGDGLFARSRPDAMWRIDGFGGARAMSVVRLPFHPDPKWKLLPGFAAAKRMLFVPAIEIAAKRAYALLRFATTGRTTAIPLQRIPDPYEWSVDANGEVVVVADDRGTIVRIRARDRETSALFEQPRATFVCWCGADVCMFTSAGEVVRRGVSEREARPVASDAHGAMKIACDGERVAWVTPRQPEGSQITAVDLR